MNTKITFSLTRLDVFRFQIFHTFRNRSFLLMILAMAVGFAFLFFPEDSRYADSVLVRLIFTFMFAAIYFAGVFLLTCLFLFVQLFSAKLSGVVGEHTLEITEDGLIEATAQNHTLHRWSDSFRIIRRGRNLIIYVSDAMAHIVPARRLSADVSLDHFEALVRARVQAATKPVEPTGTSSSPPDLPPSHASSDSPGGSLRR